MQVLAADAPPSTPGGLTASVFSTTAGEVRWDRSTDDNGAVVGYEVVRDGVALGIRDALSIVETDLSPGTPYVYDVTAIDNAGQRSGTSTVTLNTFGEGTVNTVLAPTGLSSAVYSATAAEIFWARSSTPGLRYEVQRDGVALDTIDGTSWFDNTLVGGTSYSFQVVAIDSFGRRSVASIVSLTTRNSAGTAIEAPATDNPFVVADPSAETAVARLGYPAVRDLVDDLVSMNYLSLYYDNESEMLSVLSDGPYYEEFELRCPQGGTVSGLKTPPGSFSGDFDACVFSGVTLTGHLDRVLDFAVFGAGDYRAYTVSFDDVTIDAGDNGLLVITGTSERTGGNAAIPECLGAPKITASTSNQISSAWWKTAAGVTTIDNASWMQAEVSTPVPTGEAYISPCSSTDTLSFSGEATLLSDIIGTQTAILTKQGEISIDSSEDGVTTADARLEANFGDGSTLAVTATSKTESQVDIISELVSVSFTDAYRFEARENIPGVYD